MTMMSSMMQRPQLISTLLEHAAHCHGDTEIVSRTIEGGADFEIHRYTYADALKRSKKLANALARLGVQRGERIGTLAWNSYRHFELYYGVSGMGAVIHTINPRLFPSKFPTLPITPRINIFFSISRLHPWSRSWRPR